MSGLLSWVFDILFKFGWYQKNAKILFLGIDNAGKTTLLHMLKENRLCVYPPTIHPNFEQLSIDSVNFATYDLGGHESARILWRDYYPDVDCICFLVDSVDRERLKDSKKELDALLSEEALSDVPFCVFGNKIDLPGACSEDELRYRLGLQQTTGKGLSPSQIRPLELFMCSVVAKSGYGEGFRWLSQYV